MRLSAHEASAIREEIRIIDPEAEVHLHSSRTNDSGRGGDIDLRVVSDGLDLRRALRLRAAILDRIGWQQLDLIVRRRDQLNEPLAAAVKELCRQTAHESGLISPESR